MIFSTLTRSFWMHEKYTNELPTLKKVFRKPEKLVVFNALEKKVLIGECHYLNYDNYNRITLLCIMNHEFEH